MNALPAAIEATRENISTLSSRSQRVNESNTKRLLLDPIIAALGWDLSNLAEVDTEYRHTSKDGPVDYAMFIDGAPTLFVEAKALDEDLNDYKWIKQTLNYANTCNVEWAVLTNGREWKVYKVHAQKDAEKKLFFTVRLASDDLPSIAQMLSFLSRERMAPQKRAINEAWVQREVDLEVRRLVSSLYENAAAVKALAEESETLDEKDIREGLMRVRLASNDKFEVSELADIDALVVRPNLQAKSQNYSHPASPPASAKRDAKDRTLTDIKVADMIESGHIQPGDVLRFQGFPQSEATVIDGKTCQFNNREMTYNTWGVIATDERVKNIYSKAETADGRLLKTIRREIFLGQP